MRRRADELGGGMDLPQKGAVTRRVTVSAMARPSKPTRAERRERRACVPGARVYGLLVEDAGSDSWASQVIYFAESDQAATVRRHQAGFFKRNSQSMSPGEALAEEFAFAADQPGEMFLRRWQADGWGRWYPLPADYQHPPQDLAARSPEIRRLPGEASLDHSQVSPTDRAHG